MPRLILTDEGETYTLEVDKVFRIGRHPDNDLPLRDSQISRWHAEVRLESDHYSIIDLDSLNGTMVNDEKVQSRKLENGDRINIGHFKLTWIEDAQSEQKKPERPLFGPDDIVKPIRSFALEDRQPDMSGKALPDASEPPERFQLLFQILNSLNNSESLDEFLKTTLDLTLAAAGADRGAILLEEHGQLKARVQRGIKGPFEGEVPVSSTITSKVMEEGLSVVSTDARTDPRFRKGESIAEYDIRSVVCVPLWEASGARGVLYLDNYRKTKAFTEKELDLAATVAHQVALGVRRFESMRKSKHDALARQQLERYLAPKMVDSLMERRFESQIEEMEAQERSVTVLMCDIVEFSSLAGRLRPVETGNLLSHFFDEMTTVVFRHKGSVNKFMGDAFMAVWGAPLPIENHEERACRCAADMIRGLYGFLRKIEDHKWFKVRIGIDTGNVIAGNIGSTTMLEYAVIGHPVNTADRIQELAQPNQILVSENTRKALGTEFPTEEAGDAMIKGRMENIKVHELLWREIPSMEEPE